MTQTAAFQTRARTVDHLGRGQIADAPTAISELWKNAYDAYAKSVSLHIFDGKPSIAAVMDDGAGMSRNDILERWLVIGTENKIEDDQTAETFGLPVRVRQGEKGIGRLSVAFLAPATLLVSKRAKGKFVAVLVDWRLFENPFINLEDIRLPVAEFSTSAELSAGLPGLAALLLENLGGNTENEHAKRLSAGWRRFTKFERDEGRTSTVDEIRSAWKTMPLEKTHLEQWPVFLNLDEHGTALFMLDVRHELSVWTHPRQTGSEVELVKARLKQTLTGFIDPYASDAPAFKYEVLVYSGGIARRELANQDVFGLPGLRDLEHRIEGSFDTKGTFRGTIVAFAKDLGTKTFTPSHPLPPVDQGGVGPFDLSIGTFEINEQSSTHEPNQHTHLLDQANRLGGVAVYRDFLRVMPYGRPDNDFLEMEERRGKHAGREFWASRRTFGRLAFRREANPGLRDKAGREGFVDNRAFREMKLLVIDFLKDAARKYFGTEAPLRQESLAQIEALKARRRKAAENLRAKRRKSLRDFLKRQASALREASDEAEKLTAEAKEIARSKDKNRYIELSARIAVLRLRSESLRPTAPPARLGDLEPPWRTYRDDYRNFLAGIERLDSETARVEAAIGEMNPGDVFEERLQSRRKELASQIRGYVTEIESRLEKMRALWRENERRDADLLEDRVKDLAKGLNEGTLLGALESIDGNANELGDSFALEYRAVVDALDQLLEGIDLEGAYAVTDDDRAQLEDQLRNINAVAQVGITVEIIGHELEVLDAEVQLHLSKLSEEVKASRHFKEAMRAHSALADRLRFLAPLKIGAYRPREPITGEEIARFVGDFFSDAFKSHEIDFTATSAFKKIVIRDNPARIFPVFVNLVNNALYWTSQASERRICLDFKKGHVIVGDSGPGIDEEDIARLFTIFFTRRHNGHGVGLYLSKANLAVAGHSIRYATKEDPKILRGANFIIDFKGIEAND